MTANDLTRELLTAIPVRFPGSRVWRRNTGLGYPSAVIHQAVALLRLGRALDAVALLNSARPVCFGQPGEPDIDGFIPILGMGVRLGVEVKAGRDRQRETQLVCERVYGAGGCIYILAHSVDEAIEKIAERVRLITAAMNS